MSEKVNVEKSTSMAMLTRLLGLIGGLVVGLVAFIITFASLTESETVVRIFRGIGAFFCGFLFTTAIFYLVYALVKKDRFCGIISYVAISLGTIILMILLQVKWYFILLIAVFLFVLFWLVSTAIYSKKLTLVADNKQPDYKTYEERKAEKAAAEAEKEEEPLPEIKSFKD